MSEAQRGKPVMSTFFCFDDDDVYYYIRWRLKLEGETLDVLVFSVFAGKI